MKKYTTYISIADYYKLGFKLKAKDKIRLKHKSLEIDWKILNYHPETKLWVIGRKKNESELISLNTLKKAYMIKMSFVPFEEYEKIKELAAFGAEESLRNAALECD